MGEIRSVYNIFIWKHEGKSHSEDQYVEGKIIFEWILGNKLEDCGLDSTGSGQGPVAGCCEHGNEPSGFI